MVTKESNPDLWARLKALWDSEGRAGFVVVGGTHYQVFTPDGDDNPSFKGASDDTLYSATSTGFAKAAVGKKTARGK